MNIIQKRKGWSRKEIDVGEVMRKSSWKYRTSKNSTVVPPLSMGDMFQDPHWMPETSDNSELYRQYVFPYIYTYLFT